MERRKGLYERYFKRPLDVCCALAALIVFSWLYVIITILVRINLGKPVIFKQPRPGLDGKIFNLYKFRTMNDARDENGNPLPDDVRLTRFGKWLRSTSLDEIPEAFNILKGEMSVVGPRPQLVRDMVFMTPEQRRRHTVKPGLTGLAQVNGRNAITWEEKLNFDLEYTKKISLRRDLSIILKTVFKSFVKVEGITEDNYATAVDFGDYLLANDKIDRQEFDLKWKEAFSLVANFKRTT